MPGKRTIARRLQVIAPDPRRHAEPMYDLILKTFVFGGYFIGLPYLRRDYIGHGPYDWNCSRIGVLPGAAGARVGTRSRAKAEGDGHIVTHFGVWDYTMRIGSATVRCGGIGCVATRGDHRKLGLMARTAPPSVAAMTAAGYDLSMLFGIEDFYHRFGYTRAWPEEIYTVATDTLPKERPAATLRKMPAAQPDQVLRMYQRETAGITGTAVRPVFTGRGFPGRQQGYMLTDRRGRLRGYFHLCPARPQDHRLTCVEAGGPPDLVLAALGVMARKTLCTEVRFETLPWDGPMARRLRLLNCRYEAIHRRCGGAMVRMLNLRSTLTKIAGELTRRLRGSAMADWRGDLLIADPRERVTLRIERGTVRVAEGASTRHALRGGEEIAQLLIGSDDPRRVIAAGSIKATGDALRLAEALFPAQHPQLCLWDRY